MTRMLFRSWTRTILVAVCLAGVMAAAARGQGAPGGGGAPQAPGAAARPARIVCLIPAVTEMLFAIGAGPQVAAVSSFDRYPSEVKALPRVGALLDPDLEKILSLRPDLAIVYGTQSDLRAQLTRAGVPLFAYQHARLTDVMATLRQVGARVGRSDEAARLASDIERRLEAIRQRVSGRPAPRTLVVFSREPGALRGIYASGGYGFLSDMLEIAGGANLFSDVKGESIQATSEMILVRRPEVILELRGEPMSAEEIARERAAWRPLSSVPAVRRDRIYILADERTVVPGPRIAEGTELIARALHPDAFR